MPYAYIEFIEKPELGRPEHPIDPGWGVGGGHPDHELPGRPGRPPHPSQGLPPTGRPIDPGFGQGRPPRPGHLPSYGGGRPTDPDYGVDTGSGSTGPEQLPVWPIGPDQGLPPVPGHPLPPIDPPPGTVWPPLPPSVPEGKVIALVAISGIGYRYTVLTVPPPKPDQGLPPEKPETQPPHPAQPLPPTAQPKRV